MCDQLADGRYRPGDRIGLKALASGLHVSVTPLREVLSRLVGRDLVTEHRSEGYYLSRLDARDIAALYRLHSACLHRALRTTQAELAGHDPWTSFRRIVEASGDAMLCDVHRYLADRLRLVRRYDEALFGTELEMAAELEQALAHRDLARAARTLERFHHDRVAAAAELALRFGRGAA